MFDSVKIQVMLQTSMMLHNLPNYNSFIYNEDVKDVQNLHGKFWETNEVQITNYLTSSDIKVGFPSNFTSELMFQITLFGAASEALKLRGNIYLLELKNLAQIFEERKVDIVLTSFEFSEWKTFLLPFIKLEYGIFYKAGEFHVSSTYFMDGLSTELWIYTWSTVVLMFIGFLISAKVYEKYFQVHSTIVDVAFYQMNFISNQIVESPYEKFKAWRLQKMCGWFLNIIMMTAVFTLIIALLSVKTTKEPFKTLDDFARIRSHTICLQPGMVPQKFFLDKFFKVKKQFRGIYNEPKCEQIRKKIKSVCDYDDIAMVWPIDQVNEDNIPCRLIKLTGVFPKLYGSIMIQNDFKYREHFNRMYLRMQTAGIVKRSHDRYKNKQLKKNYGAQEYYQVELEGVLFEHVKLIFLAYSLMFPLVLLVLAIEIVCSWKMSKMSSKVEPSGEPTIESDLSVYDLEIVEDSLSDNIDNVSTSTDFKMDELLEVLDLEFIE